MQTFILDMNFVESATLLDSVRLNKQSMECHQIFQVLMGKSKAWANHPAIKMWENNFVSFLSYCYAIAVECEKRNIKSPYAAYFKTVGVSEQCVEANPTWLDDDFIQRHKMALLFKTALKAVVYDYSFINNIKVIDVHSDYSFIKFINEHGKDYYLKSNEILKHYQVGKPIYKSKRVASMRVVSSAYSTYNFYKLNFGNIQHKIDYRWK